MSLDYIMIGSNNMARSRLFYDAVFACIGARVEADYGDNAICYGFRNGTRAWLARPFNGEPAVAANGSMPGFLCASQAEVQAAHAAALAHGGSDEGAPGPRPHYGPDFYGAYARDPDGNKMSFIFIQPQGA